MTKNLKKISLVLFLTVLIQCLINGCTISKEGEEVSSPTTKRKIYTGYEIGVNYITHIYTLAGAGFYDYEYVEKYEDIIPKEDIIFLKENTKLMEFIQNNMGIFAENLYFIPALNNFQNEEEWKNYFLTWEKAIEEKNSSYLEPYIRESNDKSISTMFENIDDETWKKSILPYQPTFKRIGDIFVSNFEAYKTKGWPEVKSKLKKRSEELNKLLLGINYVDRWEEITGLQFGDNDYYIALFYAGKKGPSFNNVSLYKNTAHYKFGNGSNDIMIDMFSHELGVHIMLPHISKIQNQFKEKGVSKEVLYMSNEMLATFYNEKVLNRQGTDVFNELYLRIYSKLYEEGVTNPTELYEKGVNEYLENNDCKY